MTMKLPLDALCFSLVRKFTRLVLPLAFCASLAAQTPSFVFFDAPGAGSGDEQGTVSAALNQSGVVTGHYVDSARATHGFLRQGNGVIVEFDAPGLTNTTPVAINDAGQIVGTGLRVTTFNALTHGFLRTPQGHFIAIDVPGAGLTLPMGINHNGQVVGEYTTLVGFQRGFIREVNGTYTTFDDPDGGTEDGEGTIPTAINDSGEVAGYYVDSTLHTHGFVRDQFGVVTSFDPPNGSSTTAYSINSAGDVVGSYLDSNLGFIAYLRDSAGNFTPFSMPNAGSTFARSINDLGVIVGDVSRGRLFGGFQRDASGNFTGITVPVPSEGTQVVAINNSGRIAGYYADLSNVQHGFVK
jgi:uncharacterized membrane protein